MSKHLRSWRNALAAMAVAATAALALTERLSAQSPPAATPPPAAQQPDPALRDYLSANGLLNRGMNELAVDEYRKFLAAHADHEKAPVARYGLGVALYRLKKYDEAAKELQPLIDLEGGHKKGEKFEFAAETLLIVGQSNFELKKWDQAVAPLGKLASDYPKHEAADDAAGMAIEALYRLNRFDDIDKYWSMFDANWQQSPVRERADYLRGLTLVAKKNDAEAAKHFGAMLQRAPQGEFAPRATLLRAQCLHRQGDLKNAADAYRAIAARDDDLAADATLGLAMLAQQAGDDKAAAQQYDRFLEKWPQHASAPQASLDRGRICVGEQQFDRARQLLQSAADKEPQRADEAAYWLAKCDLRQNKFPEAAARLKDAIAKYSESKLLAEMMYDRGVALAKADDAAGAIAAMNEFRGKFPDHALAADATYLQATLEHQRQRYDASADLCADFLKKQKDHPQAAAMAFLAAEDDMLRDKFQDAAKKYQSFLSAYPKDPQARTATYRLGSAQFRLQQYDEAQKTLAQVVDGKKTEKPYRRGLLMLGDIAFQQSHWDAALGLLSDYLSFGNDQPAADDAQLKIGLALARLNRTDEAATQFSDLLKNHPDSPHKLQAIFERGQALLAQDKLDDAAAQFNQVLDAGDAGARFRTFAINHLATIAMRQQQWDRAAELYAQVESAKPDEGGGGNDLAIDAMFHRGSALMAAKKYPEAAGAFATLLQEAPKSTRAPEAAAQRAIALSRSGKHEEALKAIENVERRQADKLQPDLLAAITYEKAWCLRELKRDDDAVKAYQDLLTQHPDDANVPHAMLELAEMEANGGHHDQAEQLLTKLRDAARDPKRGVEKDVQERGLYRLAVSAFELNHQEDAAKAAEDFISQFPDSELIPSAHLFAGEAEFKLSRWQPAADHFAAIIQKHKDDPGCGTAMLRLGECDAQLQRWPESEQTFTDYLQRFSSSDLWFQAQFGLGWARENRGLQDQAIEAYRKVIDKHSGPTAARAQFQIGECLFAQKKHTDAVRELLKVDILYGYPEWSAAALFEAGRVFEEMNQPAQAKSQFEQVRQKYPDTQWAKLAAQRLAASASSNAGTPGG